MALYEFLLGRQIVPIIALNVDPCIGGEFEDLDNDEKLQMLRQFLTENEGQLFYVSLILNYDGCSHLDHSNADYHGVEFNPNGVTIIHLGKDERYREISAYSPLAWDAFLKIDDTKFDGAPYAESSSGDGGGVHLVRGLVYLGNDGDEGTHIYEFGPVPFDVQAQRIHRCGRARESLLETSDLRTIIGACLLGL